MNVLCNLGYEIGCLNYLLTQDIAKLLLVAMFSMSLFVMILITLLLQFFAGLFSL